MSRNHVTEFKKMIAFMRKFLNNLRNDNLR